VEGDRPDASPPINEINQRLQEERVLIEQALAAMTRAAQAIHEQRHAERSDWRRAAIELGITLAARLVHDRITAGDFPVEELVRDMIGQVDDGPLTVHLHPDDLALLQRRLDGRPLVDEPARPSLLADPGLKRGDCRVECKDNLVLSQLEVQLEEVRRRLLEGLGRA
jgi:flagellar biosynthesis/type III secretory pathway protein FliH